MASFLNETGLSTLWSKIKTLVATKQDALPSGTAGQVLALDSNLAPMWTNPAGGSAGSAVTYTLSMTNNIITLTGSDGSTSSVTLPVYDGAFSVVGEGASF